MSLAVHRNCISCHKNDLVCPDLTWLDHFLAFTFAFQLSAHSTRQMWRTARIPSWLYWNRWLWPWCSQRPSPCLSTRTRKEPPTGEVQFLFLRYRTSKIFPFFSTSSQKSYLRRRLFRKQTHNIYRYIVSDKKCGGMQSFFGSGWSHDNYLCIAVCFVCAGLFATDLCSPNHY